MPRYSTTAIALFALLVVGHAGAAYAQSGRQTVVRHAHSSGYAHRNDAAAAQGLSRRTRTYSYSPGYSMSDPAFGSRAWWEAHHWFDPDS